MLQGAERRRFKAPERCRAGARCVYLREGNKDLACYRELFALVFKVSHRLSIRPERLRTTEARAVCGTVSATAERYPGLLRYEMDLAPYVPVLDVLNALG